MSRAACEKITTFVLELQVLSGFSTCVLALLCIILPKYQQILKEFNVQLLNLCSFEKDKWGRRSCGKWTSNWAWASMGYYAWKGWRGFWTWRQEVLCWRGAITSTDRHFPYSWGKWSSVMDGPLELAVPFCSGSKCNLADFHLKCSKNAGQKRELCYPRTEITFLY